MTSSERACINDPNVFCYICGAYMVKKQRRNITDFVHRIYLAYFGVQLGNQDKSWAPHMVCKTCVEHLRQWQKGKRISLEFGVPMIWREPKNHHDECFFCMVKIKGFNRYKKAMWDYPDLESARRPIPHGNDVPIPVFTELPDEPLSNSKESQELECIAGSSSGSKFEESSSTPQPLSQKALNDLIRDLNMSKQASEFLASKLNERNLIKAEVNITAYRTREERLLPYFNQEEELVYCNDIPGIVLQIGLIEYRPEDWRLFIDSSIRSLKCVLLHNGNSYVSLPIAYAAKLKEEYENLKIVLKKIRYQEHQWSICVDLKMVNFLLGQQFEYTKYSCFMCLWDSRAKQDHWTKVSWPTREKMIVGTENIKPLVDKNKIILPLLHIKLGLMKQFVRALDKSGNCFKYICRSFPGLSMEKLKAGIFDGPHIRKLMNDSNFTKFMNDTEASSWKSFVSVVKNYLDNHTESAENYEELVQDMLANFRNLGVNMCIKVHYLHSHLNRFSDNLGDFSEEQGERFYQDMKVMEERYQGRWDIHMMADYCWSLQRDCPDNTHKRKLHKPSFLKH